MSGTAPGSDLVVPAGPGIPEGVTIPASELRERFSKASGPGGQGVNTTDSRVELLFSPATSAAFTAAQRDRVLANLSADLVGGDLSIAAKEHRSQHRNRVAARERLAAVLRTALAPPAPSRTSTKPSRRARQRRMDSKRQRGQTKALRQRPSGGD